MPKREPTGIQIKPREDYNEYHRQYYHLRVKTKKYTKKSEEKTR